MKPPGRKLPALLNGYAFTGLFMLAVFWVMDGITVYHPPPSAVAAAPAPPAAPDKPRAFILLIDSLRYETAIDPAMMPTLAALRSRATWAEVKASYNAVTVPCLRAAFTGRDEVSVLAFVQNFVRGDAKIASVFSAMAAHGWRTAAFSNGAFKQFGDAIAPNVSADWQRETAEIHDEQLVEEALTLYRQGAHDLVIAHINFTDYAAHAHKIHGPGYRVAFRRADQLVARLHAALPAGDTLIVMGDHGHDAEGKHTLGQDVPTFALYRGARFTPGLALGRIDIMSHRWLLGELYGLPPPDESYMGGKYPAAFAARELQIDPVETDVMVPEPQTAPFGLWVYLSMLAVFAFGLLWPAAAPWAARTHYGVMVWPALLPALFPLPWNAWLGTGVALVISLGLLRGLPWRAWAGWGAAVTLGTGCHLWGRALAGLRETVHQLTSAQLGLAWIVLGSAILLGLRRDNRLRLVALAGLGAAGLLYPTNFRYGFAGIMVPLLWLWLAGYAVSLLREQHLSTRAAWGWVAGSAGLIFGFTQAFAGIEAQHHIFSHFVPVFYSLGPANGNTLVWVGLIAKLLIFFPTWPRRGLPVAVKLVLIFTLQQMQWRTWDPHPWLAAVTILALAAGWWHLRRRDAGLAEALLLGLLFFLYVYCVRPYRETYAWADCLFAALVLGARWIRRWPQPENAAGDYAVLASVAFLATGFFSVKWSIEDLEWSRIYTWLPASWVEAQAGFIVPWIVLKTALPLFIARTLLQRELHGLAPWPGPLLHRLVGLKLITLMLTLTGLGVSGTVNAAYLEGAQQAAVLIMLWVTVSF